MSTPVKMMREKSPNLCLNFAPGERIIMFWVTLLQGRSIINRCEGIKDWTLINQPVPLKFTASAWI